MPGNDNIGVNNSPPDRAFVICCHPPPSFPVFQLEEQFNHLTRIRWLGQVEFESKGHLKGLN
jgi:hypothetical protein